MAVVQISRIQIRRGKANSGTGIPQLASGELAWAVDTQELYIGNGSVAEGSPGVGNTKVLTQNDITGSGNFLDLLNYVYKPLEVQTGPNINTPIVRTLQERLDDRVSLKEFGAVGDGVVDDTAAIQRAINEIFVDQATPAYGTNSASQRARITLEFPAGRYKITNTITVPSYAKIVGDSAGGTSLVSTAVGPALQFVHNGYPAVWNNSASTRPSNISIKHLTVTMLNSDQTAILMNSATECRLENIYLTGQFSGTYNVNSIGIKLTAFSFAVTSDRNVFSDINITGFSFGIFSLHDIWANVFDNCKIGNVRQGVVLGLGADGSSVGQQYGPRNNTFNSLQADYNVRQHAIYIGLGSWNVFNNPKVGDAGQNGGNITFTQYPQVYFSSEGNTVTNLISPRITSLGTQNLSTPYVPELAGKGEYKVWSPRRLGLANVSSNTLAFRMPVNTNSSGVPQGSSIYTVDYIYTSGNNNFTRKGTLSIALNLGTSPSYNTNIQLSDEYNFAGVDTAQRSLQLTFTAVLFDQTGAVYTGALGQTPSSLAILYRNTLSGDFGSLAYSYSIIL
jgi:hypothetical protein